MDNVLETHMSTTIILETKDIDGKIKRRTFSKGTRTPSYAQIIGFRDAVYSLLDPTQETDPNVYTVVKTAFYTQEV